MACTSVVTWYVMDHDVQWKMDLQFIFFAVGVFSSRIWSALVSVTVLLLRQRSLSFVLKARPFLVVLGWGSVATTIPYLYTLDLVLYGLLFITYDYLSSIIVY